MILKEIHSLISGFKRVHQRDFHHTGNLYNFHHTSFSLSKYFRWWCHFLHVISPPPLLCRFLSLCLDTPLLPPCEVIFEQPLRKLPQELPNHLRLRILENQKILRIISKLGRHVAQFPISLQEIRLWRQQKPRKNRLKTSLFLFNFTGYLHFVPGILRPLRSPIF